MALPVIDLFDRANGALGANWTSPEGGFSIVSNAANASGGAVDRSLWTADSAPNDQVSSVILGTIHTSTDEGCGPSIRDGGGAAGDVYFAQTNTSETRLYKRVSGTYTLLGSDGPPCSAGDLLEIKAVGTTITVKRNGIAICGTPLTDSSITSGSFGMVASIGGSVLSWKAGNATPSQIYVNHTTGSGQASVSHGGVNVQKGDGIIVVASHEDSGSISGIADDSSGASNLYTERHNDASVTTATFQRIYTAIANATGTLTVTASFVNTPLFEEIAVFVARPSMRSMFVFDNATGQGAPSGGNSSPSTGTFSVSGGYGYAAAVDKPYSPGNWGDVSGWVDDNNNNGPIHAYRILTNETSLVYNPSWDGGSTNWVCSAAAFKEVPYSILQQKSADSVGSGYSSVETGATSAEISARSTLIAFVFFGNAPTVSLSDISGTNDTWTQCGARVQFGSSSYYMEMYRLENAAAGTLNLKATFTGTTVNDPAIVVYEVENLGAFDKVAAQSQTNPGTTANAITSGSTATLSATPEVVFSFTAQLETLGTVVADGGFYTTASLPVWYYGGSTWTGLLEHMLVTSNSPVSGKFKDATNGSGSTYVTFTATFKLADSILSRLNIPSQIIWM